MSRFKRVLIVFLAGFLILRLYGYLTRDKWLYLRIPGDGNAIAEIAFTHDGSTIAFSSLREPKVHVWDLRTRKRKFILDRPNVTSELRYLASGNLVGTGSSNADYARVWDSSGKVVKSIQSREEFEAELPELVCDCKFGYKVNRSIIFDYKKDKTVIFDYRLNTTGIIDSGSFEIVIFDKTTGKQVDSIRYNGGFADNGIEETDCCMNAIALAPLNPSEPTEDSWKTLILNLHTGSKYLLPWIETHSRSMAKFSSDCDFFAVNEISNFYGRGGVWDINNRQKIGDLRYSSRDFPPSVQFSPDVKRLAVGGGDTALHTFLPVPDFIGGPYGEVKIWDIPTMRLLNHYRSDRIVTAIEFSPDGRRLAVGFNDGTVEILDESFTKSQAR